MDVTEIGNRIKKRRTALELTQKDLAKEMNVSNQLISKWETGESVPSLEYLDALCKALKVDYSYFTSDENTLPAEGNTQAAQLVKANRKSNFKWNWKLFIIIAVSVFTAAFIAGFTILTIFVFVPLANRKKYFNEIDIADAKYFELGYYSINVKTEIDGDIKDDYRYDGYFDENGNQVFCDTKSKRIVKDDILTYTYGDYKYHYTPTETYETLEEMALAKVNADIDDDDMNLTKDAQEYISYIRRVKDGFYIECKDEFFTETLSGTERKNYKLTDKIKGRIEIKDGLLSSMKVTVKFLNKPDNEDFTISVIMEFIAEQPVIEHKNLDGREWYGTYVGDKWYPPQSSEIPDDPIIDTTPKCEELLSADDFVLRLSDGKSKKLDNGYNFNKLVLDGQIKNNGYYYYFINGKLTFLNTDYMFESETIDLSQYGDITDFYADFTGYYWAEFKNNECTIYRYLRREDEVECAYKFNCFTGHDPIFNGKYVLIWDQSLLAYKVIDISYGGEVHEIRDAANLYLDSHGNVYCEQEIDGKFVPVVYKHSNSLQVNYNYTVLKGKEFFKINGKIFTGKDVVYTIEDDTVYRYFYGELRYAHSTFDPIFKKNYKSLANGYCIMGTGNIYDQKGEKRKFETFKLKDENGEWKNVYDYDPKEIVAVVNDKLIVSTDRYDGYFVVYDQADLTKPLYYMKKPKGYSGNCEYGEIEIRTVNTKTFIAIRTNSVDYYGYELYYF